MATERSDMVGWMVPSANDRGYVIVGTCCTNLLSAEAKQNLTPIHRVNIEPYRQECILCGSLVVSGSAKWPILFERKPLTAGS